MSSNSTSGVQQSTSSTSSRTTELNHQKNPALNNPPAASVSARIISGSAGSLVTALVVTPLEVVKVHLQNVTPNKKVLPRNVTPCPKGCGTFVLNNGLYDCVLAKCSVPYFDEFGNLKDTSRTPVKRSAKRSAIPVKPSSSSVFSIIRSIFLAEGFRGIYAGLAPTLVMGVPSTVLYYTVYDEIVGQLRNRRNALPARVDPWIPLAAGSSARLLSTLVTAPLELIRTRQASMVGEGKEIRGMVEEFQLLVHKEGALSLYRGLGPTLWRDVPFSGIYWLCLEYFRTLLGPMVIDKSMPPNPLQLAGISFLSGASAGMVAAACTTPFDVVKTRQQVVASSFAGVTAAANASPQPEIAAACNHGGHVVYQPIATSTKINEERSLSVFGHLKGIYEAEGVKGLWRGNQARMLKVAPSCAIMITCYEIGKRMLVPEHSSR